MTQTTTCNAGIDCLDKAIQLLTPAQRAEFAFGLAIGIIILSITIVAILGWLKMK